MEYFERKIRPDMKSPHSMHIVLIDDHQLLADSLSNLLTKYEFIGDIKTFYNPLEFLAVEQQTKPDVIICDVLMPQMSGIEFLVQYKKKNKKAKIIMLSSISEVPTIRFALRSGAHGFLAKDSTSDELADAILSVYHGETYIGENLRKSLLRNSLTEDRFIYNLSPREKEVLQLVCKGKTIKESAFDMKLSVNTVQSYYKNILRKFNLNRTADLIVFAIQNGLFNPQDNTP